MNGAPFQGKKERDIDIKSRRTQIKKFFPSETQIKKCEKEKKNKKRNCKERPRRRPVCAFPGPNNRLPSAAFPSRSLSPSLATFPFRSQFTHAPPLALRDSDDWCLAPSLSDDWWAAGAGAALRQVPRSSSVSSPATSAHQVFPPFSSLPAARSRAPKP